MHLLDVVLSQCFQVHKKFIPAPKPSSNIEKLSVSTSFEKRFSKSFPLIKTKFDSASAPSLEK